jgi:hypothetical protein
MKGQSLNFELRTLNFELKHLHAVQAFVTAIKLNQFVVGAAFNNFAFMKYTNQVRIAYRR